ncbi:MAG TPA: MBL fold metallo-hydrolase [Gemmataceae bacterium]|nr:MBL fold metallo-hydrolase [Gemmataceae bacterium]
MANIKKRVAEDVPGDFFVDSTCIDCDTCRQLAPAVFAEAADHAFVHHQPASSADRRHALQALVCCPTGSIGCLGDDRPQAVMDDFPLLVEEPVFYCGFTSPKSYGGSSYFIQHPDGNWLVDSPKFLPRLVERFEALGGIAFIFLTHSDDVADAQQYAARFGSRRIIHRAELHAQPDAEIVLDGHDPVRLAEDFLAIPTPGHTAGHCVLLFRQRFLFTGDHLAWDRHRHQLEAFHDYCWYSWPRQIESMAALTRFPFEWVLPGHGQRIHLPAGEMRRQMEDLVPRMRGAED